MLHAHPMAETGKRLACAALTHIIDYCLQAVIICLSYQRCPPMRLPWTLRGDAAVTARRLLDALRSMFHSPDQGGLRYRLRGTGAVSQYVIGCHVSPSTH